MRILFVSFAILFVSAFSFGQTPIRTYLVDSSASAREHAVDMEKLSLEVSFLPEQGLVKGRVTHAFRLLQDRLDSIFFDAPGITIKEARFDGEVMPYVIRAQGVTLFFNKPIQRIVDAKTKAVRLDSISFVYEASPHKGIYFIGWDADTLKECGLQHPFNAHRKQIWTQGQGIDNRYWVPMYDDMDDKLITETTITFDKSYEVLSNGTKISDKVNKDGTRTWHYCMQHPHAPYLLMIAIGKYGIAHDRSKSGVPLSYYYYTDFPERMEPTYRYTPKIMDFLESETGLPFPWESYAQVPVQDFMFGAMENTTATVFGDFYHVDSRAFNDKSYVGVNAHELTHQWFGDYITARSSSGTWLQEGFATHYAKHFKRTVTSQEDFQWDRRNEMNSVLNASKTDRNPLAYSKAGGRVYPKGSLVLDMMRYLLGDEQYKRGIQYYLARNGYRNVDSHDLYTAFMDTLGVNLDWFFDEWVYKGGEPQYEVSWRSLIINPENIPLGQGKSVMTYESRSTEVLVDQTQVVDEQTGLFSMPILFEVYYKGGSKDSKRVIINKAHQVVTIPNLLGKEVDFVLFDPGSQILKTLVFPKKMTELSAQVLRAPDILDRYDALLAMRDSALLVKRKTLYELYDKCSFQAIRVEVLSQLAADDSMATQLLVQRALHDPAVPVRLAALQNLKHIPVALRADAEALLADSSYDVIQAALERLHADFPDSSDSYFAKTAKLAGTGSILRIKWIELHCKRYDAGYMFELVEMAGDGYEFRTRVNAIKAMSRLGMLDAKLAYNLFQAAVSFNNRLAQPALEALDKFAQEANNRSILRVCYSSHTWTEEARKVLDKYNR